MRLKLILSAIILLSLILRTWGLDRFPQSLYGDEQAFAWNAYNILKLGTDEYGNPYPLQFRSFEDYKAPIPVYLLVPFIKIFGLNSFAIRLPIAIASVLTVLATYLLAKLFFNKKISLIVTFLMAISPWHIHLSRGFFEATLALSWFILGVYFFIKSDNRLKLMFVSMIFFGLSLYSYFTPRILIPVFLIFLVWYTVRFAKFLHLRGVIISFIFLVLLSLPLIKLTFLDKGLSRFSKLQEGLDTTITATVNHERYASNLPNNWRVFFHNKAVVWMRLAKNNYFEHLSPNFWYLYGDNSLRYFTGNMGMFYLLEFPFLLIGLYYLFREKRDAAIFFIGWLFLAPIPASIVGRSFAVRSMAMLPAPFIFVGYGIHKLVRRDANSGVSLRKYLLSGIIILGFVISLGSLLIRYYLEYPVYAATWWGWENKAAIDYAQKRQERYDRIFISDFYTGAPLAFAVYTKYDPVSYYYAVNHPIKIADGRQVIKLGKYYFGSLDLNDNRLKEKIIPDKTLYIGRPEEPEGEDKIVAPDDGRLIFVVHDTLRKL